MDLPLRHRHRLRAAARRDLGGGWLLEPSFAEPLILALALLVLPYFVMMPGMGMGIAGSRTPKPNVTRLKSVIGHSIFGIGMYLAARLLEAAA